MKILIIPDVHGRTFWRKAEELVKEYQKIIFLGDYLDPYCQERITPDMAFKEFKDIIKFKKEYPKKVTLLLGNHDLHYIPTYSINSTRKNWLKARDYERIYIENKDLFSCFELIKSYDHKWLFSHAGISQHWLRYNKLLLSKLLNMSLDELLDNKEIRNVGILEQVSYHRGGEYEYGSPVWADISETIDSNMVIDEKTTQIVGHNQVKTICSAKGIFFTDCRKLISLDTKTKQLNII